MSYFKLEPSYKYTLHAMPRGRHSSTPITNTCNLPYNTIVIDLNSNCLICSCDGYLPIPVGKVQEFNTIEEVFNSPIAKILQNDIADKKYTWCAVDHCGIKFHNIESTKYNLLINIDESCNLHCPSCRRDPIMHVGGPIVDQKTKDLVQITKWLENFEHRIHITLSGNGDPLASVVIRPLFKNYKPQPFQTFKLHTNGLLIKKQLSDSLILPNITDYSISVDAGSKDVYENIRRGGKWQVLIENLEFLNDLKVNNLVNLNFALQKNNWQDLLNFVDLCQHYQFGGIIHQLDDWGTWNFDEVLNPDVWTLQNGTFTSNNILNKMHPQHDACKKILVDIRNQEYPNINFTPAIQQILTA